MYINKVADYYKKSYYKAAHGKEFSRMIINQFKNVVSAQKHPVFYEKFKKVPENFGIRLALTSTISAQIFTLPILIYNFGRISLFSIPANILIVPWLPLITVYGFIIVFLGIFFLPLSQILSWPAWLILALFTKIIDFISSLKFASLTLENIHWTWPIILYLILGWIIYKINLKFKMQISK